MGLLDEFSDFAATPKGQGLLSAAFAGLAGAGRLRPTNLAGSMGMAGLQGYSAAQDQDVKLQDMRNQAMLRDAQLQNMKRTQMLMDQALGNGPSSSSMPASVSALGQGAQIGDQPGGFDGNGSYSAPVKNIGPTNSNAQRMQAQPAPNQNMMYGVPRQAIAYDLGFNGGKNVGEWINKRNTPDMTVTDGYAYDKNRLPVGFIPGIHTSADGKTTVITPDGQGGVGVSVPRGALTAQASQTIAQELPKALISGGMRREDFVNPDGTTSSKTGLQFAKQSGGIDDLLGMLGRLDGGGTPYSQPAPTQPTQPVPQSAPQPQQMVIPPKVQAKRDADRLAILQTEYDNAQSPQDKQALAREMSRLGTVPRSTKSAGGGVVSGISSAQQIENDRQRASATRQAEADVTPIETRRNSIANLNQIINTIDNVANHPGLQQGTGTQGWLDPRNYIPGTTAKDFQVAASQLHGQAFLGVYERLRGSGQISNVEGAKAEDALARLNTAQTSDAYIKALGDFRTVIQGALDRAKLAMPAGKPTNFPGDMSSQSAASPKTDLQSAAQAELRRRGIVK